MQTVTIAGWNIVLTHFAEHKTLAQLKKDERVFTNLPKKERDEAFKQLFSAINGVNK